MKTINFLLIIMLCCRIMAQQNTSSELRPFHLGICYPLSTNGTDAPKIANKYALHALIGMSKGVEGFDIAGFMTLTGGNVNGIQAAGFSNITDGNIDGIQASGFCNVSKDVDGLQIAGFSNIGNKLKGLQGAGFVNISGSATGMQGTGFMNITGNSDGLQIAGFMNIAGNASGFQGAGFMNIAGTVDGAQAAGFINIAGKVDGTQIGFINVADSCDYPIGIINVVRSGKHQIALWTNELSTINLSYRSGGRKTYGLIGMGVNPYHTDLNYSIHYGIGLHNAISPKFNLDVEAVSEQYTKKLFQSGKNNYTTVQSIRLLAVYKLLDKFEIFAGPSVSLLMTDNTYAFSRPKFWFWSKNNHSNSDLTMLKAYVGGTIGIQYQFK